MDKENQDTDITLLPFPTTPVEIEVYHFVVSQLMFLNQAYIKTETEAKKCSCFQCLNQARIDRDWLNNFTEDFICPE